MVGDYMPYWHEVYTPLCDPPSYVLIWLTGPPGSGIRGLVFSPLLYFCSYEYVFTGASFSV